MNDEQPEALKLPSATAEFQHIKRMFYDRMPAVFLDYDGTLTPIVDDPAHAQISSEMRDLLSDLSSCCYVIIVSGRDRQNVKDKVGLDKLYYAGSHGYDITGPGGLQLEQEEAQKLLPVFDNVEHVLKERLGFIEDIEVERKKYAIAVHYRQVEEKYIQKIEAEITEVLEKYPSLKKGLGKKIIEIKPDLDWHKGKALLWIMEKLNLGKETHIPVYAGDDITDEDAFDVIHDKGIGVLVGNHGSGTRANYRLKDVSEVQQWLQGLTRFLKEDKC